MEDNLSQIITSVSVASRLTQTSVLRPKPKIDCHAPRHRFKTHSQCQRRGQIPLADRSRISCFHLWSILSAAAAKHRYAAEVLVERIGIEPMTSSLQS